jgi:ribosomal protein L6P/L9E
MLKIFKRIVNKFMAQLIKPNNVKVLTQDNEVKVSISLELTINLNSDGLNVSASSAQISKEPSEKITEDKTDWLIPDFDTAPLINFGKKD